MKAIKHNTAARWKHFQNSNFQVHTYNLLVFKRIKNFHVKKSDNLVIKHHNTTDITSLYTDFINVCSFKIRIFSFNETTFLCI